MARVNFGSARWGRRGGRSDAYALSKVSRLP
jgi:hypothetical protein